jgi:hypothetical protein
VLGRRAGGPRLTGHALQRVEPPAAPPEPVAPALPALVPDVPDVAGAVPPVVPGVLPPVVSAAEPPRVPDRLAVPGPAVVPVPAAPMLVVLPPVFRSRAQQPDVARRG